MRIRRKKNGIAVHAISGTHVVMLGLDATAAARRGLLGFAIERTDHTEDERYWLKGYKTFEATIPHPEPGSLHSTLEHPIQSFLWADYTAKPEHTYTYRIRPMKGRPKSLQAGVDVVVKIQTEPVDKGTHAIYFNRGAIASQAYARKFGNLPPDQTEAPDVAQAWLSRGLLEGALEFIAQAKSSRFALRAALYEFTYDPILQALKAAAGRGADVKIVYEAGKEKKNGRSVLTSTSKGNAKAIQQAHIPAELLIKRTKRKAIPHNKFIVLLDRGRPVEVWTGSTNVTQSGFLGQSNVGHLVRDEGVAQAFRDYWEQLSTDPEWNDFRQWVEAHNPRPGALPPDSITALFSPRSSSGMLDWYADRIEAANRLVMFTAAFGVNKKLAERFAIDEDFLRFIITEKKPSPANMELLRRDRDTKIAFGATLGRDARRYKIPGWELDEWYKGEELFRKQGHIFYVHTKYLGIDLLTSDPLVFSGSANFSTNSLLRNDENMLLIRGNEHVADIYLTEFDRLFRHFFFRSVANQLARAGRLNERRAAYLDATDAWTGEHFRRGSFKSRRREMLR